MTDEAQTIHITPSSPEGCGGVVRYTTNGNDPTPSSTVYPSGGITVYPGHSALIKAAVYGSSMSTGPVLTVDVTVNGNE